MPCLVSQPCREGRQRPPITPLFRIFIRKQVLREFVIPVTPPLNNCYCGLQIRGEF